MYSDDQFYFSVKMSHFMIRCYAINKSNPALRRMIAYSTTDRNSEGEGDQKLPIFLQYVSTHQKDPEKNKIQPHGNATKSNRPFTSSLPSVLSEIKVS